MYVSSGSSELVPHRASLFSTAMLRRPHYAPVNVRLGFFRERYFNCRVHLRRCKLATNDDGRISLENSYRASQHATLLLMMTIGPDETVGCSGVSTVVASTCASF